jgi:6-phosphofructo-2-kinase
MRMKLSGPDYAGKDPVESLRDFKMRVAAYESAYVPIGAYEEENQMQYIQVSQTPAVCCLIDCLFTNFR